MSPAPNERPRVVIREVGLRDGLQSVATIVPTAAKIEWLHDAWAAGQREIGGSAKARDATADDQEIRATRHRMLS